MHNPLTSCIVLVQGDVADFWDSGIGYPIVRSIRLHRAIGRPIRCKRISETPEQARLPCRQILSFGRPCPEKSQTRLKLRFFVVCQQNDSSQTILIFSLYLGVNKIMIIFALWRSKIFARLCLFPLLETPFIYLTQTSL